MITNDDVDEIVSQALEAQKGESRQTQAVDSIRPRE